MKISIDKHFCRKIAAVHTGNHIRSAMARSKVSSKAMAAHCGVTPGAVSAWFSTGRISKANLLKVAALLQVDIAELITGEQATSPRAEDAPAVAPAPVTPAAMQLAQIYDWLTDPIDREVVRNLMTQAVLERLSRVKEDAGAARSSASPATRSSGRQAPVDSK
jgi:transcriptional regulator with XRE-family HTH domain